MSAKQRKKRKKQLQKGYKQAKVIQTRSEVIKKEEEQRADDELSKKLSSLDM